MKLLAGSQPQMGLAPSPASRMVIGLVLLISSLAPAHACMTRSGQDGERVVSHQGEEPEYHPQDPYAPSPGQAAEVVDGGHEEGEVQVGQKWEFPVAQLDIGNLWGTIEESRGGKRVLAFRGIRHLQPPVGELRWQPPRFSPKWEGIKDAKTNGHVCPQHLASKPDIWVGDEDCLWLNVFTRDLVVAKRRPVVVWIHGGSFSRGSAAEYDPDYLLDQDIVLVTLQYRLGMFGFLSTETKDAPGNYGMLDQVAGLQWVKRHISAFSGDPGSITIMGQQAGGASVHYHLLSPLTRGLFHRAVSMSGSALCWWASLKRPQERAKKLAKLVDCKENEEMDKMVACLRDTPMFQLMNTHPNFYAWKHLQQTQEPVTAWSPRVDPEAGMSFMPNEPIDLMTSGNFQHVPWMTGITDDEGATRAYAFFEDMEGVREWEEKFAELGPLVFGLHDGQSEAPKIMAKKVKDFYLGPTPLEPSTPEGLVNAISDSSYAHPVDTAAKVHALKSAAPVFVYHFGYRGKHSQTHVKPNEFPQVLAAPDTHYGVGNGDDLMYLFPILMGLFRPLPSEDIAFSMRMVELLTSFARTGRPSIVMGEDQPPFIWDHVNAANASHLNIGNMMMMDQGLPNHQRMAFWGGMPVYWNADRSNYAPAPPIMRKEEL